MPWYQAKVLCDMLGRLLRSYEELNGRFRLPKLPDGPKGGL
jgi:hypothetical protein